MKKIHSIIAVALLSGLFLIPGRSAQAGLFLDPYVGYSVGTFSLDSSLGTSESDTDSMLAGLRIGYSKAGFFIGPDITFHLPGDFEPSIADPNLGPTGDPNGDANLGSVFLTMGYKLPVLPLRGYVGYSIYSTYSLDFSDGSDADFEGSGGYKIGIGYQPGFLIFRAPFNINLEYKMDKFDEASGVGVLGGDNTEFPFITGTGPSIATYNDADVESIVLTVSLPFSLFD